MKEKLQRAYPATPESFNRQMLETLASLPPRRVRRGARAALAVALAATLMLGGLAFAVTQSNLLNRLFGGAEPTKQAERLLVQLENAVEKDGATLTVHEYLLDGADLYVDWTVSSSRSEPLLLFSSGLISDLDAEAIYDEEYSAWELSSAILLDEEKPSYSAVSRLHLNGESPKTAVEVGLTVALMEPLMPLVSDEDCGDLNGEPTLLTYFWSDENAMVSPTSQRTVNGDAWSCACPELYEGDTDDFDGYLRRLEELGYAEEVLRIPVAFTVTPQPEKMVHTEIVGQRAFVFEPFILTVEEADFTAAGAKLRCRIVPRDAADPWSSLASELWFEVLPDGRRTDNAYMQSTTAQDGALIVEIIARAGSEIPKFVRLIPCDESGRMLTQYTADLRLKSTEG